MTPNAVGAAMSPPWITVFHGSMAEVLVCQGLLEANGLRTHILDENIKFIDPFITGANAFGVQLQVTESDAVEAKEILDYRPPPDEEPEPRDSTEERVRDLGFRIRWASIASITAPYALWLAWPYYSGSKQLDRLPEEHRWTIAAIVYSVLLLFVILSLYVTR